MSFATKHAHNGPLFTYQLPEGDKTYLKLKDLQPGTDYELKGLFISKSSQFVKEQPNAVISYAIVNLPQHLLDDVRDMMADEDDVQAINAGTAGFRVIQKNGKKGTYLSVQWIDL